MMRAWAPLIWRGLRSRRIWRLAVPPGMASSSRRGRWRRCLGICASWAWPRCRRLPCRRTWRGASGRLSLLAGGRARASAHSRLRGAGFAGGRDELGDLGGVGDHRDVAGGHLDAGRAAMRAANVRSASGGMAWSSVATRYQVGSDFQAGVPITSVNVEPASACCTTCITLARNGSSRRRSGSRSYPAAAGRSSGAELSERCPSL